MSKIQWEYDLVERPYCGHLDAMGWQWIEDDTDVPETVQVSCRTAGLAT